MKLMPAHIKRIETLLAEGHRVEIYIEKEQELDAGYGQTIRRQEQITVAGRPQNEGVLHFNPVLVSDSDRTVVTVSAGQGEDVIALASVEVPAGIYIMGFLTGRP